MNFTTSADIEQAIWDPFSANIFYFTQEDGTLAAFDVKNPKEALFQVKAHKKSATTVAVSTGVKGLVATASHDGNCKIWDVNTIKNGEPLLLLDKPMKAVSIVI